MRRKVPDTSKRMRQNDISVQPCFTSGRSFMSGVMSTSLTFSGIFVSNDCSVIVGSQP